MPGAAAAVLFRPGPPSKSLRSRANRTLSSGDYHALVIKLRTCSFPSLASFRRVSVAVLQVKFSPEAPARADASAAFLEFVFRKVEMCDINTQPDGKKK